MIVSRDGGTGLELPNGTWIGTTGDLISDKADIAICTGANRERSEMQFL